VFDKETCVLFSTVALILAFLGIDFDARSMHNEMLEVERCSGEGELEEEEYERCMFRDSELRPARGGRVFEPKCVGAGYERDFSE
jgi:hypothetical protein